MATAASSLGTHPTTALLVIASPSSLQLQASSFQNLIAKPWNWKAPHLVENKRRRPRLIAKIGDSRSWRPGRVCGARLLHLRCQESGGSGFRGLSASPTGALKPELRRSPDHEFPVRTANPDAGLRPSQFRFSSFEFRVSTPDASTDPATLRSSGTNHKSQVTSHASRITSHESRVAIQDSPVTHFAP
jgi:hypothetical protein